MQKTNTITIEQLVPPPPDAPFPPEFIDYIVECGPLISAQFGNVFDYQNTPIRSLVEKGIFLVAKKNGKVTGHLVCYIYPSPLDAKVKILYQLSFWVKPNSGRAAYHLFRKFIDIGKDRANHIITQRTPHTNIKASTLEGMGFKELETLYRMEII